VLLVHVHVTLLQVSVFEDERCAVFSSILLCRLKRPSKLGAHLRGKGNKPKGAGRKKKTDTKEPSLSDLCDRMATAEHTRDQLYWTKVGFKALGVWNVYLQSAHRK
jgi:hypothetical protein